MKEPQLIDELISSEKEPSTQSEINGRWYIAKPLPFYGFITIRMRIYHAWLVLIGKATAIQYMEDRI